MTRVSLLVAIFAAFTAAPAVANGPSPGAPGVGDRLFPTLGNGGYDVQHYDVDLRYATASPKQSMDGTVTILARATQALSRFDLDFGGASVGGVSVDGADAKFRRDGDELVITPRRAIDNGALFVVTVAHYVAVPTAPDNNDFATEAFFYHPSGSATAGQPNFTHLFLPSNDHPSDKATFDIRFDVPASLTAVANGVPVAHWTDHGRAHSVYVQRQPMATELIQLAVGHYDITTPDARSNVFIRDVTAQPLTAKFKQLPHVTPSQIYWMSPRAAGYPVDVYGSLVIDQDIGFALETQTLELIDSSWYDDYGQGVWDDTLLHELSHMWFGDSVSPKTWSDLWLNEGHASWYEFLYAAEDGSLEDDTEGYPDDNGYANFDDLMKAVYAHGDEWRASDGPVALPTSEDTLFNNQRYHGGALVLYALRQKIGAVAFQRIERAFVERFKDQSVSTSDYIALAAQVSARPDVAPFLRDWLYGTRTPPMPGHPDWKVNPAPTLRALSVAGGHARS